MFKPLGDKVLLRPLPQPKQTEAGIHIPAQAQDNLQSQFTVVAVGPKAEGIEPGQTVLGNTFAGLEIMLGGAKYRVVEASSILGVFEIAQEPAPTRPSEVMAQIQAQPVEPARRGPGRPPKQSPVATAAAP